MSIYIYKYILHICSNHQPQGPKGPSGSQVFPASWMGTGGLVGQFLRFDEWAFRPCAHSTLDMWFELVRYFHPVCAFFVYGAGQALYLGISDHSRRSNGLLSNVVLS